MNKKVLSAILFSALFAGTGTFTSCIDNDEPTGIEDLRGAKAELLRAQAAMQLAHEAYRKAEVAEKELQNEGLRLDNEAKEIDNQIKALELALKEEQNDKAIAELQLEIQKQKNALLVLAETFKAEMLDAQTKALDAQTKYDAAVAAAELAKLTLDAQSKAVVDGALANMNARAQAMNRAYESLKNARLGLMDALTSDAEIVSEGKLKAEVVVAENDVKIEEIKVADAEKMLALAKEFDTETWAAQLDSLREDSLAAAQSKAAAQVALDALYVGAEYQAAEKAYAEAAYKLGYSEDQVNEGAWNETSKKYVKGTIDAKAKPETQTYGENNDSTLYYKHYLAQADSSKAVKGTLTYDKENNLTTNFKIEKYQSDPVDDALITFFANASSPLSKLSGYNKETGVFSYVGGSYTETDYRKDSVEYKKAIAADPEATYNATSAALQSLMTVEGWVNALNAYKVDTNGIAWTQTLLEGARKDSTNKQELFDEAKAKWQVLVDAVNGEEKDAPTDSVSKNLDGTENHTYDLAGAIAAYNDSVASLTAAVKKYNDAIDSIAKYEKKVYDAKYNAHITETKDAYYLAEYIKYAVANSLITSADKTKYDADVAADPKKETLAHFNTYLKAVDAAVCKAAVDLTATKYSPDKDGKESAAMTELKKQAAGLAESAVSADYIAGEKSVLAPWVKKYEAAKKAMNATNGEVQDAWGLVQNRYASYMTLLENDYGQVITATNLTKYPDPTNPKDSIEVGEAKYVSYAKNYPETNIKNVLWDVIKADFGGVAGINELPDYTEKKDSVYPSYDGINYVYFKTIGSDISAAEEENLSVTEINQALAINKLLSKSATAYGSIFDWETNKEARLVEVTEEMVKDHMEKTTGAAYSDYGALGALMEAKAEVELILAQKDADKLIKPLYDTLKAQFDALKAEIDANSAIVAAYEKISKDAYLEFQAGKALIEKLENDRDALSAEAEAEVELYQDIIDEKEAVIQSATAQLKQLVGTSEQWAGDLTTEKVIASWEKAVAEAEKQVEVKKLALAKAEKALELYKQGLYNEGIKIEMAQLAVETAQKSYDAAAELYELAVAEYNAILEALAK